MFDWVDEVLQWLLDVLLWVPRKLYQLILEGLLTVFNAIPVPSWAEGLDLDWIPAGMAYFLEPFNVAFGVTCITSAYLLRFLIRRIPVVG